MRVLVGAARTGVTLAAACLMALQALAVSSPAIAATRGAADGAAVLMDTVAGADVSFSADFEDSSTVSVGDVITSQYPFVKFDAFNAAGYGFTTGQPGDGTLAQIGYSNPIVTASAGFGGSNAGQTDCGAEFCASGTFGVLNDSADAISVDVGSEAFGSIPVELDAYDANRKFLGSSTLTTSALGANTLISFTAPSGASIAYFTVYHVNTGGGNDYLYIDNLTIDVPAGAAPAVGVSATTSGYEVGQDGTISIPLTIQRLNGATGAVTLDVSGFTSTVTGSAADPGTASTSTLTVSAAHSAPLTGFPITISASEVGAISEPSLTITITVVTPVSIVAPASVTAQTCRSQKIAVEAQIAPGEPGSTVSFATNWLIGTTGLDAQVTSPVTIANGLADATVQLSSTGGGKDTSLLVTATLANGDHDVVATAIVREGPSITSADGLVNGVAGTHAMTPRAGRPGTTIEVYGTGFCDSATVAVGNTKATVTAVVQHLSGVNGPYDYIRIATPRLATSGPLTVTAGSPASTGDPSSTTLAVDSYRNTDAWNFHNFDPVLTFDDLTQAYGENQTYMSVDLCGFLSLGVVTCPAKLVPDLSALALLGIAQATMETGTCFGFALSSQRILEGKAALSSLPGSPATIYQAPAPTVSPPSVQDIHGAQPVLDLLKSAHLMQLSTQFITQWTGATTGDQVSSGGTGDSIAAAISTVLSQGRYPLVEIQDQGGHVVVAYDIEATGPGTYDIYAYDSNDEFTSAENAADGTTHATNLGNSVIHISADGSWSLASTTEPGGEPWHGGAGSLVVTDPGIIPLHPTLPSAGGLALPGMLFSSLGSPGTTGGSAASSAAITQVSDAGRTLYDSTGALNTDPATRLDATPFSPFTGGASVSASALPQLITFGGDVSGIKVASEGSAAGPASLSFLKGPYSAQVNWSASTGVVQSAAFSAGGGSVAFAGNSSSAVTLAVTRTASQGEHSVKVTLAAAGKGDDLTLGATGAVTVSHSGPRTTFALTVSGKKASGLPETSFTGPLAIGPGQSARISGIRWGSRGGTVTVTVGGNTMTVQLHADAPRPPRISTVGVRSLGSHKYSFTVKAKLPSMPAGSRAFVVWLVHRGNHLLAAHHIALPGRAGTLTARWQASLAKFRKLWGKRLTFSAVVGTIAEHAGTQSAAQRSLSTRFNLG